MYMVGVFMLVWLHCLNLYIKNNTGVSSLYVLTKSEFRNGCSVKLSEWRLFNSSFSLGDSCFKNLNVQFYIFPPRHSES